ncbi:uncharacterized protein LOC116197457 [Punica granatum]|uniref:Uncharacterized protein n=2 Tax=Punica granatum TaxID=22663 RepID=A0A218W4U9_PUNGR|nr:uncharacterized protein LOC116197457 [Punica granatum]OWM67904.1 hypothetical protein CDL15_Pgr010842 [Punica granatum]PKI63808.1 hypothetical protein CRG98_015792 [Punica granatum]
MGITISSSRNRVKSAVSKSPEFDSACDSAFAHCLSLTQHSFPGVFPYQLPAASAHLHRSLSSSLPLVRRWVPSPPSRSQIDSALRLVLHQTRPPPPLPDGTQILGQAEFKQWAAELFGAAVVENAGKAVLTRVPVGIAGIAGLGLVTRSGKELVGSAIGVYALGVATSIYLSLSG